MNKREIPYCIFPRSTGITEKLLLYAWRKFEFSDYDDMINKVPISSIYYRFTLMPRAIKYRCVLRSLYDAVPVIGEIVCDMKHDYSNSFYLIFKPEKPESMTVKMINTNTKYVLDKLNPETGYNIIFNHNYVK